MRVMVIVKATRSSEAGELPSQQLMADMGRFNEELVKAGIMKSGDGLKPSSKGVRVHFSGSDRTVTDGPFAETKELIAGYWLWEVESIEQAVAWVKRCPNPMIEDSDIEIRPFYEAADFAEWDATGEFVRHEGGLRDTLVVQQSVVQPYLFFSGWCEEALAFYTTALGATVGMMMRFNESPDPAVMQMLPPGFENKVMHCEFKVGSLGVMASDGCGESTALSGFRLALQVPTEADADRVFSALAEGGTIDMPMCKTFFSPRYGQVTDRFNVGWMVMVPADQ